MNQIYDCPLCNKPLIAEGFVRKCTDCPLNFSTLINSTAFTIFYSIWINELYFRSCILATNYISARSIICFTFYQFNNNNATELSEYINPSFFKNCKTEKDFREKLNILLLFQ